MIKIYTHNSRSCLVTCSQPDRIMPSQGGTGCSMHYRPDQPPYPAQQTVLARRQPGGSVIVVHVVVQVSVQVGPGNTWVNSVAGLSMFQQVLDIPRYNLFYGILNIQVSSLFIIKLGKDHAIK